MKKKLLLPLSLALVTVSSYAMKEENELTRTVVPGMKTEDREITVEQYLDALKYVKEELWNKTKPEYSSSHTLERLGIKSTDYKSLTKLGAMMLFSLDNIEKETLAQGLLEYHKSCRSEVFGPLGSQVMCIPQLENEIEDLNKKVEYFMVQEKEANNLFTETLGELEAERAITLELQLSLQEKDNELNEKQKTIEHLEYLAGQKGQENYSLMEQLEKSEREKEEITAVLQRLINAQKEEENATNKATELLEKLTVRSYKTTTFMPTSRIYHTTYGEEEGSFLKSSFNPNLTNEERDLDLGLTQYTPVQTTQINPVEESDEKTPEND